MKSRVKSVINGIISKKPVPIDFLRNHGFKIVFGLIFLTILILFFSIIKFDRNLSHLDLTLYSGPGKGNYYAIAGTASGIAAGKRGKIKNIETSGSIDNIAMLKKNIDNGKNQFAIVQDGISLEKSAGFKLIARLPYSETVFFVGRDAGKIKNLSDIRGMRIGIGPVGSGTDYLLRQIFKLPGFNKLNVKLVNHSILEQIKLASRKKLDLAVFVITEQSALIESIMKKQRLKIVSFRQSRSIAERVPYLKAGTISTGYFDPVRNIPERDKLVLKVDTLVVSSGAGKRSDVMGLLRVLSDINPNLINYNKNTINMTGLELSEYAQNFFNNNGPEFLDLYAPRLVNYLPLGTLVQMVMIVSIMFNIMAAGDRFSLWRIDEKRIKIENSIKDFFGGDVVYDEISRLKPLNRHSEEESHEKLQEIINELGQLLERIRKQSRSILVPMGKVMGYRYQENLVGNHLSGLRTYFRKLKASGS